MSRLSYRLVPGRDDCKVTACGNVLVQDNSGLWHVPKPQPAEYGHLRIQLPHGDGRRWSVGIHHLVLLTFGPPRPTRQHECRHLDGDPTNNVLENLCWGTKKDNADDRAKHGRTANGERHGSCKLTAAKVRLVFRLRTRGWSQQRIANRLGVSRRGIRLILSGENWSHLQLG